MINKSLITDTSNILLTIVIVNFISCKDNIIEPENHKPSIISLIASHETVNPGDSLVVTCRASDPDGDTLVYDWITTGVVRIKDALNDEHWLYNTIENSRTFFAPDSQFVQEPIDTFWVQCFARDRKGMSDAKLVYFTVIKAK